MNGDRNDAPTFAAASACSGVKISVTLTRMPRLASAWVAFRPSMIIGHLTTMFLWSLASFSPSSIIADASVATTSALIGPSTISQISRSTS